MHVIVECLKLSQAYSAYSDDFLSHFVHSIAEKKMPYSKNENDDEK